MKPCKREELKRRKKNIEFKLYKYIKVFVL